ncbi:MAG: allophanate hydrolase [Cytophagales bacterium CG12_big_fil_rev_8_21_14_0_65_40_12]|nr:MAG: allophanate hydrolase [Cytophagales bacterium CG12_big_fil_rev_8_21_14_0_65_40_12]
MKILAFGDSALLVNFEQKIDDAINQEVLDLAAALKAVPEVTYLIPAYCSLTVGFDASLNNFTEMCDLIENSAKSKSSSTKTNVSVIEIPVCYDAEFALDLEEVMEQTGLSSTEIIELHTTTIFKVYMLGFVAGFAYMGSLPEALKVARKKQPRKLVNEGAVGLAGIQTGIYPTDAPGGWQIIGQCPIKMFDPTRNQPSLLQPGDQVQFKAIDRKEFETLRLMAYPQTTWHD